MANLVFECPATGQEVSTGVDLDHSSYICLPKDTVRVRCPHCSVFHELSGVKVRLAEGSTEARPDTADGVT